MSEKKDKAKAGPSKRNTEESADSDSERTSGEEDDKTEGNKDKKALIKADFLLSLQTVTQKQFNDKKFFGKLIKSGNAKMTKSMSEDEFKREKGELKFNQSGIWRPLVLLKNKISKTKKKKTENGKHQTYIGITIPRKEIEGMTVREIWEWVRNEDPPRKTYVGGTFSDKVGMRKDHFHSKKGETRVSSLRNDLDVNDTRCFEVAVIITETEEERKELEEYVIHYLAAQEEDKNDMKMLNMWTDFGITPDLRARARNLYAAGVPLIMYEEEGAIVPAKRFELGFICTPHNFKEKKLSGV